MSRVVDLASIVEALEIHFDERRVFLDRDTGELHDFGPDELAAAETDNPTDVDGT